ncbi:P27 family phage terminase small subunit [Sutcliffiella horikoshii]|uniref:P27 family phage terminase small subunit n=1 Tax=Sutcliffiella horikoshii TaxID=79883 RepID=UPI003CE6B275
MPWKPKKICRYPDCHELCDGRYCDKHKQQVTKEHNKSNSKIYTYQWRKTSKTFLKDNPLCIHCQKSGRLSIAQQNLKQMRNFCSELGLSPSARSRLNINNAGNTIEGDEMEELLLSIPKAEDLMRRSD